MSALWRISDATGDKKLQTKKPMHINVTVPTRLHTESFNLVELDLQLKPSIHRYIISC